MKLSRNYLPLRSKTKNYAIMKKILFFMLAALPLVFGSCSSDDEEINGTSGSIDVTVTFSDEDIAAKRNKHNYYVYLISTEGYTLTSEPQIDGHRYYIEVKDSNGKEDRLYAEWRGNSVTFDTELISYVGNYGSVFPYGKCVLILEEWKGAAKWYRYSYTSVNESNSIKLEYGSSLWREPAY